MPRAAMPEGVETIPRLLAAWADRVTLDRLVAVVFMRVDQERLVAPTAVVGVVPDRPLVPRTQAAEEAAEAIVSG